ncbi:ROK family protein [Oscillibacter valericigenes]|uniref:ROK family protein n=1 Tax=Oscillibacter valericigenes TaxID=351091 RepID=UPI001F2A44F0|nr:ROK family protein [Oscillibacter valericigenes]MCF2617346.1 ROK family protein [Oscillibacter valericigenes]
MYIGIDVGGTNLKAGLVDQSGTILAVERTPLDFRGPESFADTLASLAKAVMASGGAAAQDVEYVGIGIPGAVAGGDILYTANIPMKNVPLEKLFRQHLNLPVLLGNDADCAAVGEWSCGVGRGTKHFIVITLGTGVGGGMILNGKLYSGCGAGGEVGHIVVQKDGVPCNCGRRGCWEAYASATGLIRETTEAMKAHPESLLHQVAAQNGAVDGRTSFQAAEQGDETALAVCRSYAEYLASGLTDLVNILHPEAVALGGGVAAAPEYLLLDPVREIVARECYARHVGQVPHIVRAELGNDAGIIGAAMLGRAI